MTMDQSVAVPSNHMYPHSDRFASDVAAVAFANLAKKRRDDEASAVQMVIGMVDMSVCMVVGIVVAGIVVGIGIGVDIEVGMDPVLAGTMDYQNQCLSSYVEGAIVAYLQLLAVAVD